MTNPLPHAGFRVLDFGHTVMGPTAGLVLADLGAEVIRVEPVQGDPTRRLRGFGSGYFPFYSRGKRSIALDLKEPCGLDVAKRLIGTADVLIENFAPGTMDRLGLGYEAIADDFPRLIYLSLKGFLPGPYEDRVALDEIVQMMSGLAYMTGPPGQPLRAGASVVDVMGGVMGVVAVQAALLERERTGRGQYVTSALFECAAFLMGQHLAYSAVSGAPVPPMPARVSAWAIYDQFDTKDGKRVFLGVTSDQQWQRFCEAFGLTEASEDSSLATNNQRIAARDRLLPLVAKAVGALTLKDLERRALGAKLPFAPVARPEYLFDDPHLAAGQRLAPATLLDGTETQLPVLPVELGGRPAGTRGNPPAAGADTESLLAELGYSSDDIAALLADGVAAQADRGDTS